MLTISKVKHQHEDGSVVIRYTKCTYQHGDTAGVLHREDGPAYEKYKPDGSLEAREWFYEGKYHREGGPAVERYFKGVGCDQAWYQHGKRHRTDGPAVIQYNTTERSVFEEYYIHGTILSKKEFYSNNFNIKHLCFNAPEHCAVCGCSTGFYFSCVEDQELSGIRLNCAKCGRPTLLKPADKSVNKFIIGTGATVHVDIYSKLHSV